MSKREKIQPLIPKVPKWHSIFGSKFIKNHYFVDPKWMPNDRVEQYRYMCDVFEKYNKFIQLQNGVEHRKQKKQLSGLKQECRDGRTKLKMALYGNTQRMKNLLQHHRDLQRLYQVMPTHMVIENISQRTFVKRKERDRLQYRKNQLTIIYENKILELSKLQDKIRYDDEVSLVDERDAKKIRMELKNSETRLRAFKTITIAYKQIIASLMQDAIYYDSVLISLKNDIEEQATFINQTIQIGLPAIGNLRHLTEEYTQFEKKTRKNAQDRMSTLVTYRLKVSANNSEVKRLVRRDSDFEIHLHRYDRETDSMLNLKSKLEDVEKIITQVKNATLCARVTEIYPTMQKQMINNTKLEKSLNFREREKNILQEKDKRAEAMKNTLKHNSSPEEIERHNKRKELIEKISEQKKIQADCAKHMKERGELFSILRNSLQHFSDVLRHVGEPVGMPRRPYPDPDLKLPLLKFDAFALRAYPPKPVEDNAEKLLKSVKQKVRELMSIYNEEKCIEVQSEAMKEYHNAYLRGMGEVEAKPPEVAPLFQEIYSDDPEVPNRKQIKAASEKIVEEKSKEED